MDSGRPGKPVRPEQQVRKPGKPVLPGPPLANAILARFQSSRSLPEPIQSKPAHAGPPLASEILARFRPQKMAQPKAIDQSSKGIHRLPGPPLASAILSRFHPEAKGPAQGKVHRPYPPIASEILSRFHHIRGAQRSVQQKGRAVLQGYRAQVPKAVIQRMDTEMTEPDVMERIHRTRERNLTEKSEPLGQRDIFGVQSQSSYGYTHTDISYGGTNTSFRRGWGNQPFLSGGVNYDEIVAAIESSGVDQTRVAEAIIARIDDQKSGYMDELATGKPALLKAMQELIVLTQVIESHDTRAPGWDKVARSLLVAILNGRRNFKQCFNRKDGLFLPAWRKKAGAACGGQEAVRAFMNLVRKKNDKRQIDDGLIISLVSDLYEAIAEMSDSSDEDEED